MRLSKFFALAVLALCLGAARAQVGVYLTSTGQHMSSVSFTYTADATSITPPPGTTKRGTGSFSPLGATLGTYYDFASIGRFRIGADARGSITSSKKDAVANATDPATGAPYSPQASLAGAKIYSALGGIRASMPARFHAIRFNPYTQLSAGLIRTNYGVYVPVYNGPNGRVTSFAASAFLGADVALAPIVALRFEGGAGAAFAGSKPSSLAKLNYAVDSGTKPLYNFSIGVVFRFNRD